VLLDHFRLFAGEAPASGRKPVPDGSCRESRRLPRAGGLKPSSGRGPFTKALASCSANRAPAIGVSSIGMEAGRLRFEIEAAGPAAAKGPAENCAGRRAPRTGCGHRRPEGQFPSSGRLGPAAGRRQAYGSQEGYDAAPPLDRLFPWGR